MNSQRVGLTAFRRAAVQPNNAYVRTLAATMVQFRPSTTVVTMTAEDAQSNLAAQRLKRPVSPHLTIYKYDQTWFGGSAWQRITGATMSCSLYGFSLLYLVAPVVGFHPESASIAALVGSLPFAAKAGIKFLMAWPFAFHAWNGVRHLVMDLGFAFSKSAIVTGGWGTWFLGLGTAIGLVAFY